MDGHHKSLEAIWLLEVDIAKMNGNIPSLDRFQPVIYVGLML
jgi:hypothetical protein